MNIGDFLGIGIVGAAMSALMQYFKTTSGTKSKFLAIGLSLVVGTVYVLFRHTVWWETVVAVLAAASAVYAMFFN